MDAKKIVAHAEAEKAKRKHNGATKRAAQERYGKFYEMLSTNAATAAKSADIQFANARSATGGGRKERADPETNVLAMQRIKKVSLKHAPKLEAREFTLVKVHGAELLCERLSVLIEVAAMSPPAALVNSLLNDNAFIARRRDAILRVLPGPANQSVRNRFGFDQAVRPNSPTSTKRAARKLLAGKKAFPKTRAATLLNADDEKRLRAVVKAISAQQLASEIARDDGTARTTERDILNCALELFYDDFEASIGLALEDDEVARLQALELVPRRAERRAEADAPVEGQGDGSTTSAAPPAVAPVAG